MQDNRARSMKILCNPATVHLTSHYTIGRYPGVRVHNMLRVQVCAARIGGFLGPKFPKQVSRFLQIFHKRGLLSRS